MSKIEVNQISSQCGSTLTIGQSGDTVTLAAGATQSGFGRTGTVDWDTTAKTASFTAVSGNGYFVNTTSAAITLTLPASPSAGDIVAFKDYAFTFATNNLTVDGNGSPIGGVDGVTLPTYSTNGTSKTFIYVDGTKGWLVTNESTDTSQETNAQYVTATGGTVTCCGDYKIHTFTGPGTFCVSCAGNPLGSDTVDYLVAAGGGGGGQSTSADNGGGGGGGGYRESSGSASGCYTRSPLGACVSALSVTAQGYPIVVGAGGSRGSCGPTVAHGGAGSNSIFSTITSAGGGGGGGNAPGLNPTFPPNGRLGGSGGSGGGAGGGSNTNNSGGSGNSPPVSPPQGQNGGNSSPTAPPDGAGGGGGGATEAGVTGGSPNTNGGRGGAGATSSINGTPTARAGGGGSGSGAGSPCGSGTAGVTGTDGPDAAANSAGGGGGNKCGSGGYQSGAGGSGIVIIRYKYQN